MNIITKFYKILSLILLITLTACSVPSTVIEGENSSLNPANTIKTAYFKLDLPTEYENTENNFIVYNEDDDLSLGVSGIYSLSPYTAIEAFDGIKESFSLREDVDFISDSLTLYTSSENTTLYTANVSFKASENSFVETEFLFVPSHNLIISLSLNSSSKENLDTQLLLDLKESLTFRDISNNLFINATFDDNNGGLLELNEDGSFKYYISASDDSDYFYGEYKSDFSTSAIDLLIELPSLEDSNDVFTEFYTEQLITYTPFNSISQENENYIVCGNDFYTLILYSKARVIDEKESEIAEIIPYYGFYVSSLNSFDLINLSNGESILFSFTD